MNLYEINSQILDCVDPETGEVMDIDRLEELTMAKAEKVDNIACWVKNLEADVAAFEAQEKAFAESPLTHADFLIYNSLTKRPIQTIEVDGWHFHRENKAQQSRDALKDRILTKFGLCPHRISTTDTVNEEAVMKILLATS